MQEAVRLSWGAQSEERLLLVAVFLSALLIRVAVIVGTVGFYAPGVFEPAADSRIHMALVQSLLDGRGYSLDGHPTAITPPLYIFFLAGLYKVFGSPAAVRLGQALLGAGGCLVLYKIGTRLMGQATGLVAAVILALHPLPAYLAGLHLTENLFLFLLLLVILQALRAAERPTPFAVAALGGLFGLAVLTRAAFLGFLPFILVWAISVWGGRTLFAYRVFALVAVVALLVILPWAIRNYLALGVVVPVQSNGGMVFWAGNNPRSDGQMVWPSRGTWTATALPDDGMYGWRGMNPTEQNRRYVTAAVEWIRQHPRDYVRLLAHKLGRLYGFARAADEQESTVPVPVVVFHLGLLFSALVGLFLTARSWRMLSLVLGLIIFTNAVTLLFSGATRYSVPMLPSVILLAAAALVTGCGRVARAVEAEAAS